MYNTPFFQYRSPLLLLLILFVWTVELAAREAVACFNWNSRTLSERAPNPSDCRHILNHLPDINHLSNSPNTISRSNAFFPNAQFIHSSFIIVIELIDTRPNVIRSSTAIALEGWHSMTRAAASIIVQCVDDGKSGFNSGYVGMTDQIYAVMVERNGWYPSLTYDQIRAMADGPANENLPRPVGHHNGLFGRTIYHI